MANTSPGLIGRKIGMTQLFHNGDAVAVTVVEAGPNHVIAVKKSDGVDGYDAVQLGFTEQKESRVSQAEQGHFAKADVPLLKHVQEFRVSPDDLASFQVGSAIGPDALFSEDDTVDVTGTSKGRGFAGVMKKFNFKGFIRSHGSHEYFRHGGSIGTRLTPGHVQKGKKMPGQFGAATRTVQNLTVIKVDAEKNLLFIKGGVPGPNGGIVRVRRAVKG
ncbi:MAG: 50S ribosomal protein L3 [Oligoflexia bacterium]|nr:50S ribosomal protein L3 [Oligoflexia bacterium]